MFRPSSLLLISAMVGAAQQGAEIATIERNGNRAILRADTYRPMEAIATKLGGSAEDPSYRFAGDMTDISLEVSKARPGTMVPRHHKIEVEFEADEDGRPRDLPSLLERIVAVENAQTPFAYRLDRDGESFIFVPTRTRDEHGTSIPAVALLDRKVTIPWGRRSLVESAMLMSADLSRQTGLRVSCCQSSVAGVPWGIELVDFGATDETARAVLKKLGVYRWWMRCDREWCFIEMRR